MSVWRQDQYLDQAYNAIGRCQFTGPKAPLCCPARLEWGSTIGEQRRSRPEPPCHRHNEHTTGG
jgi:hypothetical protein